MKPFSFDNFVNFAMRGKAVLEYHELDTSDVDAFYFQNRVEKQMGGITYFKDYYLIDCLILIAEYDCNSLELKFTYVPISETDKKSKTKVMDVKLSEGEFETLPDIQSAAVKETYYDDKYIYEFIEYPEVRTYATIPLYKSFLYRLSYKLKELQPMDRIEKEIVNINKMLDEIA